MKKIFVFAAMAIVVFASCQKSETVATTTNSNEIGIVAFNDVRTKGYTAWTSATGSTGTTDFTEVEDPENPGSTPADRTMKLSAYQKGAVNADYFTDVTFEKGTDTPTPYWHATPNKIYYPLGGDTFQFLAYSVGKAGNYIGVWDGAKKVTLQVNDEFFQDDILYASNANTTQTAATNLTFKHAQAWINMNFVLSNDSADIDNFTIENVTWKNVKGQGKLTIAFDDANITTPKATWDFYGIETNEVEMADAEEVLYGEPLSKAAAATPVKAEYKSVNMLLPEQASKTPGFVVNYAIGTQKFEYEFKFEEANKPQWKAGTKYIYNVIITINEITMNPKVEWFVVPVATEIEF